MKRILAVAAVVAAGSILQCESPFGAVKDQTANTQPFKVTATINGESFTGGGNCGITSSPDGEYMTVTATEVGISGGIKTITLGILAPAGQTAPFDGDFTATSCVATFTDGQNTDNTWSTANGGSGTMHFTYWSCNSAGTGYAEGTFSFVGKKTDQTTATITGGRLTKN